MPSFLLRALVSFLFRKTTKVGIDLFGASSPTIADLFFFLFFLRKHLLLLEIEQSPLPIPYKFVQNPKHNL